MCTLVFAWDRHPHYRFVFAGNRDEFHQRPTAAMHQWESPKIIAGRDLQAGGTWLGITPDGHFAVVTNFRDGRRPDGDKLSRGELVVDYLQCADTDTFRQRLSAVGQQYSGYNLIFGDLTAALYHHSNRGQTGGINREIHGLSNHLLDTPWPKVNRATRELDRLLQSSESSVLDPEQLFALLGDRTQASSGELPDTGVGTEMEQLLSSTFIVSPGYGTRSSTVLLLDHDGRLQIIERTYDALGTQQDEQAFELQL